MEVKDDHIVELTPNFWHKLQDLLNWPENQIGYLLVDDYIKWAEKVAVNHIKNVKFYTLNGDFSDGTFVVVVSEVDFKTD